MNLNGCVLENVCYSWIERISLAMEDFHFKRNKRHAGKLETQENDIIVINTKN